MSSELTHYLMVKGNGTSGNAMARMYKQAGTLGHPMGWFNLGNCLIFGTMGIEKDLEQGLEMWAKGAALVKKSGGRGLERWGDESNEKAACGDVLSLCSLLGY